MPNYAFIDGQNLYQGFCRLDWQPDWRRLRVHLKETYDVTEALYFIGYMKEREALYGHLRRSGYQLVFKEVIRIHGTPKGSYSTSVCHESP